MTDPRLPARVRRLFRLASRSDDAARADADDELASFLEARSDDLVARGMARDDACAEALRRLGKASRDELGDRLRRSARRRERRLGWREQVASLGQDARLGLRRLAREPVVAAVAVLTLALGVGTNTAIFTVVDDVLLRALPVAGPNELVAIGKVTAIDGHTTGGARPDLFSLPLYRDIRGRARTVSGLVATGTTGRLDVRLSEGGEFEHPNGRFVSANYFDVLGVGAERGRVLGAADEGAAGTTPVAIVSDAYWRGRLGGASNVVGRTISVDGITLTIAGVAGRGFGGEVVERPTDIWIPLDMQPVLQPHSPSIASRGTCWLLLLGRLAPGMTLAGARAEFTSLVRATLAAGEASPELAARFRQAPVNVVSGAQGFSAIRRSFRSALVTLQAGVAVLLLIVCTNLANLVLARAAARGPEMSLRMALGAGRRRLVRQMMTESSVIGALGAVAGFAAAWWGSRALVAAATAGGAAVVPSISWPVLAFTIAISVGATLCFGLVPAFQASRSDVASPIRSLGRTVGSVGGRGRIPVGRLLVPLQVGLSLVLLTGTALLARGLERTETASMGLDRDHLVVAVLDPARLGISGQGFLALTDQLTARIRALPGVQAATYSQNGLFDGYESTALVAIPGFTGRTSDDSLLPYDLVGPGYARAIGATLLRGRELDARDGRGQPSVAVINEAAERFYFGGGNAIGKAIYFDAGVPTTVVGVVGDVRDHSLGGPDARRAYAPYAQQIADADAPSLVLEIRTRGDPAAMVATVRAAITAVNAEVPIVNVSPLSVLVRESIRQQRVLVWLAFGFGLAALLLAAVGLYGVMSYAVTRRTGEIGLRCALGASRVEVLRLILRDGLGLVALGIVGGLPLAWVAARALGSQLNLAATGDPVSMAIALGVLVTCATVAALVPALRATRVAPAIALSSAR